MARSQRELFKRGGAQLYLVDGDESALLQCGKDSLVSKLGETGFSFSNLPARLKYALSLDNLDTTEIRKLEFLFQKYSTYFHADIDATQATATFWTRLARNMDRKRPESLPDDVDLGGLATLSAVQKRGIVDCMQSPNLVRRMQQARRMSAVAKLFVRSIERGTINASTHVEKVDTDAHIEELAIASVDAVAKVVEAVETAGKTLLESAHAVGSDILAESEDTHRGSGKEVAESFDVVGNLITSAWTLNKVGLHMLFRTIANINSSASMRTVSQSSISTDASGRSSTTSDLGSVSSTSTKSPAASAENNSSQMQYGASPLLGGLSMQSTSAQQAGITSLPNDGMISRCLPIPAEPSLPCWRRNPPMLPVHLTERTAAPGPPPPLPPRFYARSTASDHCGSRGVMTGLTLASGGSATGPASPSSHVYRSHATPLQAHMSSTMTMPPPCSPRPRPRSPRPRPPFH
ncbi:hypothetical protein GOP47_0019484 [Adiantum capillus-veneris]|uniref:Uncharacterized protein n=1 Tax=Adiantum capillus-veneris TaxID=13818 RepID=A0A9D4UB50_ADICA|nr:hypothetical protein GOP47_0019484 [Adiantum capillus-veneris]